MKLLSNAVFLNFELEAKTRNPFTHHNSELSWQAKSFDKKKREQKGSISTCQTYNVTHA